MFAAIYLALAAQQLAHWSVRRRSFGHLLFAVSAIGAAGESYFERVGFTARTVAELSAAYRLAVVPLAVMLISMVAFVLVYLGSGRRWLAFALAGAWVVRVVAQLLSPTPLIFAHVDALKHLSLPWGETLAVPAGVPSLASFALSVVDLALLAFTVDATVAGWRRGARRCAVVIGGSLSFFMLLTVVHTTLIKYGVVAMPWFVSLAYCPVLAVMAIQLSMDAARAVSATEALDASERRWRLVRENVPLLMVLTDPRGIIEYVNPQFTRVTGQAPSDMIGRGLRDAIPDAVLEPAGNGPSDLAMGERGTGASSKVRSGILRTRAGVERSVMWTTVPRDPAASMGTLSIGVDVTDQIEAEAARDDANAKLRSALQARDEALAASSSAVRELEALRNQLEERVVSLQTELASASSAEIIGSSDAIKYVLHRIKQVAPLQTTVLIEGETGVGKELVARAIHAESPLNQRPMVAVNCASLPPTLIEDELFGHERGAFTGANRARKGRFELADGSTLFLDEVAELPMELQAKLLRVLEQGELQRLGGDKTIKVTVRLIAATAKNLMAEVEVGRFRQDLYYRLQVYPLTVPALRHRKEDVPALVQKFVAELAGVQGKRIDKIPQAVSDELVAYEWPGNVRELRNVIERAVIHTTGDVLRLRERLVRRAAPTAERDPLSGAEALQGYRGTMKNVERQYVSDVLAMCRWRIEGRGGAAELLGMHPNTVRYRLHKLGLRRPVTPPTPTPDGTARRESD